MTPVQQPTPRDRQRQQVWIIGALGGLLFGLIGAYLFNQAGGDEEITGETHAVPPGSILTLVIALFAILRQIIELGRPETPKQTNKRRR
jgi:drug/metabolite transporter (DMT)-like permease